MTTTITMPSKCLRYWVDLNPMLQRAFWFVASIWPLDTLRITSIYRTPEHDRHIKKKSVEDYVRGIHTVGPPYRSIDISVTGLTSAMLADVAERVNAAFDYDTKRPSKFVCYVKPHGTGPHIHLQVHPNTRRSM